MQDIFYVNHLKTSLSHFRSHVADLKIEGKIFVLETLLIIFLTIGIISTTILYLKVVNQYKMLEKNTISVREHGYVETEVVEMTKKIEAYRETVEKIKADLATSQDKQREVNKTMKILKEENKEEEENYKKAIELINTDLTTAKVEKDEKDKEIAKLKKEIEGLDDEKLKKEKAINQLTFSINKQKEDTSQKEAVYYYNLGIAYIKAKEYDQAIYNLEKSLEPNLIIPEAYYNLGLLSQFQLKDYPKALGYYNDYLKVRPDAAEKEQILKWIEQMR
ncbi:MAG: hypothetical protein V1872_01155 [bacterium]